MCPPKEPVTPTCTNGLYEYVYETEIGDLTCWLDHQPAERQTHWEPGCDEALDLVNVWLKDIDIVDRIPDEIKVSIEECALEALLADREQDRCDQYEARNYE